MQFQKVDGYFTSEEFYSGFCVVVVGIAGLLVSRNYEMGTASTMGPGYFPRALCWILIMVGAAIGLGGLRSREPNFDESHRVRLLPLVLIPLSYIVFAFTIEQAGLVVASLLLVVISGVSSPGRRLPGIVAIAVPMLILVTGVWYLVGIQVPLLPWGE